MSEMRKRILKYVFTLCALLSLSVNVFAFTEGQIPIQPRWTYVNIVSTQLSISSSGTATATAKLTGYSGTTTKIETYMYLQQYINGNWQTIQSCSQTDKSYMSTLQGSYSVSKGYKYRVMAEYYSYSGNPYEKIVDYSAEVSY